MEKGGNAEQEENIRRRKKLGQRKRTRTGGKRRKLFGENVTTERQRHIMKIELGFWALKLHFSEYYRDQFPFLFKRGPRD